MRSEQVCSSILGLYSSLGFSPPAGKFTVLAGFALVDPESEEIEIISLGTGSKCLPTNRLPVNGEAIHDSHAEVLARRGALRWLFEQDETCKWFQKSTVDGKFALREGVQLVLYISTVPCGDASMGLLAALQDPVMAALKDSGVQAPVSVFGISRGRDNYALLGVLRTKPGRADSPPTSCMSCSDKIASWNVLGIQGALGSTLYAPVYISRVIIGNVDLSLQDRVRQDCTRALWGRLESLQGLPAGYALHRPTIEFTDTSFVHSAASLGSTASCNDSLCWTGGYSEVLINGLKRGVSPKHRNTEKFLPRLCQRSFLNLHCTKMYMNPKATSYHDLKQTVSGHQAAKRVLMGPTKEGIAGPFAGWVRNVAQRSWA